MTSTGIILDLERRHAHLMRERFLTDPVGLLMVVLGTFILGYGEVVTDSPLKIPFFEAWAGAVFSGVEMIILLLVPLALVRRIVARDPYVHPSNATLPLMAIAVVLALIPYARMVLNEGGLRVPFEANFFPFFILMFFIWRLIFHPSDMRLMVWMIITAAAYKCLEGILIFLTEGVLWGLLTGWRDAMLTTLLVSGLILSFTIRPTHEAWYRKIRLALTLLAPFSAFVFIGSMRRSFIFALLASLPIVAMTLKSTERKRMFRIFLALLPLLIVSTLIIGADVFTSRFSGVTTPTEEGSAAWRLIEFYNVIRMITEHPIIGWPWGVEFVNYTGIDLPKINSLIPHNPYLYALLRGGVFGLIVWLWFLIVMLRMNFRAIRNAPTPGYRFVACWMATGTLLIIFSGATNPVVASKLIILYPFMMVLSGFLPGAVTRPFPMRLSALRFWRRSDPAVG